MPVMSVNTKASVAQSEEKTGQEHAFSTRVTLHRFSIAGALAMLVLSTISALAGFMDIAFFIVAAVLTLIICHRSFTQRVPVNVAPVQDTAAFPLLSIDNFPDMVTIHDSSGEMITANQSAKKWFSQSTQDFSSYENNFISRILVSDRPLFLKAVSDVFYGTKTISIRFRLQNSEKSTPSKEKDRKAQSEKFQWVEVNMQLLPDSSLKAREGAVMCMIRPIEEFMTALSQIEREQEKKTHSEHVRDIMMRQAYKEIEVPLQAIQGYAQLLATDILAFSPDQRQDYANRIQEAAKCALATTSELNSPIQAETNQDVFDLNKLTQECCHMIRNQASCKGVFLLGETEPSVLININENVCRQVILNLLSYNIENAFRGDRIRAHFEKRPKHPGQMQPVLYITRVSAQRYRQSDVPEYTKMESPFRAKGDILQNNYDLMMIQRRLNAMGGEFRIEQIDQEYSSFCIVWPAMSEYLEKSSSEVVNFSLKEKERRRKDKYRYKESGSIENCA